MSRWLSTRNIDHEVCLNPDVLFKCRVEVWGCEYGLAVVGALFRNRDVLAFSGECDEHRLTVTCSII